MKDFRSYGHKLLTGLLVMSVVLNIVLLARPAPKQGQAVEEGTPDFSDPLPDIREPEPEVVKAEETEPEPRRRHYGVTVATDWEESRGVPVPYPIDLADKEVLQTIQDSLREAFGRMTDNFLGCDKYWYSTKYLTDDLFQINMVLFHDGTEFRPDDRFYSSVDYLIDLQTGKILYLDDVVDMDGLSEAIRVEGILRKPEEYLDPGNRDYVAQDEIDFYHAFYMRMVYEACKPYENVYLKPGFYLTPDRLYLTYLYPASRVPWDLYINLEDIQDILKIDIL